MAIEQLFNILLSEQPSILIPAHEEEIFSLIPELRACKGFEQNNPWHIYDVYEHILHVVDAVPNNLDIRVAALFHDIGKPCVYTEDENGIGHFYDHWTQSKEIFMRFANQYQLDQNMITLVSNLIFYHDINIDKLSDEQIRSLMNDIGIEHISLLFNLKRADLLAQSPQYHYLMENYDTQEKSVIKLYAK